ncbi:hypothetical protein [Nocardia concava]|uniref:hypothetical protein n=1 Tax=Nocardia concava TaxID=257281 RepID=UPI0012FAECD1|nr:hypothetical protein [Nocardia concava]
MTFDIVAFTLAGLYLAATFAMLTIGLIGVLGSPVSIRCRECSRWIIDIRGEETSTCRRCRLHPTSPTVRRRAHGAG